MTNADDLYQQSQDSLEHLGLSEIPFTESPIDLEKEGILKRVFTGREAELRRVFSLFQSCGRRRILVYGWIGIGKSAFVLEVLGVLRRNEKKMLTAYTTLQPDQDLATAAVFALMRVMPEDEWVERQFNLMGVPTKPLKERSSEAGGNLVFSGKVSEKDMPVGQLKNASLSFEVLLDRALKKYPRGVVIAIDDLDKQDRDRVRQLLHNAQGLLKGRAWFLLTGHPSGLMGDLLTSERGLFDLQLELKLLDADTTYQMLINYLNSARIQNDCTDPADPRSVLPFLPETARQLCDLSKGHPRRLNRLGAAVLDTALVMQADRITPDVLQAGLQAASRQLLEQAALDVKEMMVFKLLQERGALSDESLSFEDLQQLGVRSFVELLPMLDRIEQADLIQRRPNSPATIYDPIELPAVEDLDE
jgi:AAA ATPase domain